VLGTLIQSTPSHLVYFTIHLTSTSNRRPSVQTVCLLQAPPATNPVHASPPSCMSDVKWSAISRGHVWQCVSVDFVPRWRVSSTLTPNPKLEDHPLSSVCDWLYNIFAATVRLPRAQHEDALYRCSSAHLLWKGQIGTLQCPDECRRCLRMVPYRHMANIDCGGRGESL
jgi:hypothetical protein